MASFPRQVELVEGAGIKMGFVEGVGIKMGLV